MILSIGPEFLIERFQEAITLYICFAILIIIFLVFAYTFVKRRLEKLNESINQSNTNLPKLIKEGNHVEIGGIINSNFERAKIAIQKYSANLFLFNSLNLILLGFISIFGSYILINQNSLIENQNRRLDQQTYLQEAERRSSLVFMLDGIMQDIDKELKSDSSGNLSEGLIGRIISISHALKPYHFLRGDTLTKKELSPERGQLLINLTNSKISKQTLNRIYLTGNFTDSDLTGFVCSKCWLENINLTGSDLSNSLIMHTRLQNVNFSDAIISANFINVIFRYTVFKDANISNCTFTTGEFQEMNFDPAAERYGFQNTIVESENWFDELISNKIKGAEKLKDNYIIKRNIKNEFEINIK